MMLDEDESDVFMANLDWYHPRYSRWDDQRICCWAGISRVLKMDDLVTIPKGWCSHKVASAGSLHFRIHGKEL